MNEFAWPLLGSVAALILSFTLVLATGLEWIDLVVVLGLLILFWVLTRMSKREMGLRWGSRSGYRLSLIYPVSVSLVLGVAAALVGRVMIDQSPSKTVTNFVLMFANTWLGALITEEGFFRGWLWGSLRRARVSERGTVLWTSVVFCLWHIPAATVAPSFELPAGVVPVYLGNVLVLGLTWGVLRAAFGSIVLVSFCHAVWNALVYTFFGYGIETGALGIADWRMIDPERGVLGLVVNLVVLVLFWRWWRRRLVVSRAQHNNRSDDWSGSRPSGRPGGRPSGSAPPSSS